MGDWSWSKSNDPTFANKSPDDFEVLEQIASSSMRTPNSPAPPIPQDPGRVRITIQQELNYEREAQNLIVLGKNLKEFELIQVPQPIPDYSTRSVLTMDYVQGRKITSVGPLGRLEIRARRWPRNCSGPI